MKAIINSLHKLFNISPEEWPRVSLLFVMTALTNSGFVWGLTTALAAFLKGGSGLETLPWLLVLIAIFSILAIATYTPFVDRIEHDKLMIGLFMIEAVGIVLGLGLIGLGYTLFAYPYLYLLGHSVIAVANPHQATYINSFYHTQAAKRVVPVVNAGFRVGGIVAGFTIGLLNSWFNNPVMAIVVWLLTHVAMMGLVWFMPTLLKERDVQDTMVDRKGLINPPEPARRLPSFFGNMREGFRFTVGSTYLRWMAIAALLLMTLMALLDYRATELFAARSDTTAELANFLGVLTGAANVLVVPLLLFGTSRLIARLGLANMSLIFPGGNLLACASLIAFPHLVTASLVYLVRNEFRLAFEAPVSNLLYNAVSLRVKGRARAFVSGLLMPVGSLLGGLFLILFAVFLPLPGVISALILILAAAYLGSILVLRKRYSQALITMLTQEDYSFLLFQQGAELAAADPATLKFLEKKLEESHNPQLTAFIAQLIAQMDGAGAAAILAQRVRSTEDAPTRSAIIDIIAAADMRSEQIRQLFSDFTKDPEAKVRQSAIAGLERAVGLDHEQFRSAALSLVNDPDIEVRVQALSALARWSDFYELAPAVEAWTQLLAERDPLLRAYGVRVLGTLVEVMTARRLTNVTRQVYQLTTYLADPDDRVRLQAALALETVSKNRLTDPLAELIIQQASRSIHDPVERIRQAALVIYSRLGQQEAYPLLVEALIDPSQPVRATAVDSLARLGKAIIPVIQPQLASPNPELGKMAAVALCQVDKHRFGAIIPAYLNSNLLRIYQNYGYLAALPTHDELIGVTILQSTLREQNQRLLDEIFYLLSNLHGYTALKVITDSLHQEDIRIRANAVEALEALTTPQVAKLAGRLFEPALNPSQLLEPGKAVWGLHPPALPEVVEQFIHQSGDPWLRAAMIFALGEAVMAAPAMKAGRQAVNLLGTAWRIDEIITQAIDDPDTGVRRAAQAVRRMLAGQNLVALRMASYAARRDGNSTNGASPAEEASLSTIEKVILLKRVAFFQGMTIDQLKILADVCKEELFEEDRRIFKEGEPGGVLYVVIGGRVGIEKAGKRTTSTSRLATIEAPSYFGESNLFDNSPRTTAAIALQDTLTLSLHREPLLALARQYPDLSLELIHVLSQRLREVNAHIVGLARTRSTGVHKALGQLDGVLDRTRD